MSRVARIVPEAWALVQAQALRSYPDEACGILLGRAGKSPQILEAYGAENVVTERSRDRYLIDPRRQLSVEKEARLRGLDVVGYFHSHPDHPAAASPTDLERSWEELLYLIVSVRGGRVAERGCWLRPAGSAAFESVLLDGAAL